MKRALEKRRAEAQADAAAILREMEAADARAASDLDKAARGGRMRFGSGSRRQQHQVPSCNLTF
jgi:hypothetical protein